MSNVLAKDRKPSGLEFLVYPHDLEVYTVQNAKAIPKTHTFTGYMKRKDGYVTKKNMDRLYNLLIIERWDYVEDNAT